MTPQDQTLQAKIEIRYRTLMTLWGALAMSIVLYFVFARFLISRDAALVPNSRLTIAFMAAGLLCVVISQIVRRSFVRRAEAEQSIAVVQTGYLMAWAVNEVAALLGLLDYLIAAGPYYYVLFGIASVGILIHIPRRGDLLAASYKGQ